MTNAIPVVGLVFSTIWVAGNLASLLLTPRPSAARIAWFFISAAFAGYWTGRVFG